MYMTFVSNHGPQAVSTPLYKVPLRLVVAITANVTCGMTIKSHSESRDINPVLPQQLSTVAAACSPPRGFRININIASALLV